MVSSKSRNKKNEWKSRDYRESTVKEWFRNQVGESQF